MGIRYYLDERPEGRSEEEQAEINRRNEEEWWQRIEKAVQGAADYIHKKQEIRFAIDEGRLAIVREELSVLEFNDDYTMAKYGGKEVKFKKGGLECEMLRILVRAAVDKSKTVQEERLVGSLGLATGRDDVIYKTVRNTRDRINKKLYDGFGLNEVIEMVGSKYWLKERYLHQPQAPKSKIKSDFFLNYRG